MKLNINAFGITSGLVLGTGLFCFTWWVILFEGVTRETTLIGTLYRGYSISPGGSFIGLGYGLVDGMIFGALFAWLYNMLAAKPDKTS
ncbi:MAG: hypothetical protein D3926_21160 [Desulfobacteraceae bacterium]|nr:MAG: hypothetical protein D3926_21160 [Desulfobacteraceae bacterium]